MRLDIEKAVREGGLVEAEVPLGPLEWEDDTVLQAAPAALKGRLTRVRRGFEFEAAVQGGLTGIECVRCLTPFSLPLSFDFHLFFVSGELPPPAAENHIQDADCDFYACTDNKVDIADVIREQIYLHIPLKPVCTDQCRGLCLTCRESLNRGPCRCGKPASVRVI